MKYHKLFQPIKIRNLEIKNRLAMAPMGTFLGHIDNLGVPTKRWVDYYTERAKGGVGLIITGLFSVENEIDKKLSYCPLISRGVLSPFGELAEAAHALNSKVFIQLTAGYGRVGHPMILSDQQPVSASEIPYYWDPTRLCRELTTEEVEYIIKRFGDAAEICSMAGIDGVEIHAVHEGYLLDQFAIALFNKRTDRFGGDLEGRLRFATEIVREIKNRVGNTFPVSLRFSVKSFIKDWRKGALPNEVFEERGRDIDEGLIAAKILEGAGYDAFNADGGTYDAWYWPHPPNYQDHGCYLPLTEKLKGVVNVPVMVAGRMDIPELAEKTLQEGKAADIIAIGRGLLADPYWLKKIQLDAIEDIRPCLGCHDGCIGRETRGRSLSCAVNPSAGREGEFIFEKVQHHKNVVVVGGGVAGLEAARSLALRGHKVTLYEKTDRLGGHIIAGSVPDFKMDVGRLLVWYKTQLEKLKVEIRYKTEFTSKMVEQKKCDMVIIATGSNYIMPDLPGIKNSIVGTASEILLGKKDAGENVAVIGGGLVGCETALWLAKNGKKVTIIEKLNDLLSWGQPVPHPNKVMLLDLLEQFKVEKITNHTAGEITDNGVIIFNQEREKKLIEIDTVVIAAGLKKNSDLYDGLKGEHYEIYVIGDSREQRNIMGSIWDAFLLANMV